MPHHCRSFELGAYTDADAQRKGALVWPGLDNNPEGFTNGEYTPVPRPATPTVHQAYYYPEQVQIFTIDGQVVATHPMTASTGYSADTQQFRNRLTPGIYFLKYSGKSMSATRRMVIVH